MTWAEAAARPSSHLQYQVVPSNALQFCARICARKVTTVTHPYGPLFFGGEIGLGFRTVVPANLPYVLLATIFLSANLRMAGAAAFGWAFGRLGPIAWGTRTWDRGGGLYPLVRGQRWFSVTGLTLLLVVAGAALTTNL